MSLFSLDEQEKKRIYNEVSVSDKLWVQTSSVCQHLK